MSKKLWMGLVPILATLALIPAVAQAAPHYYKSGVLIPEGEKVPVLEWGKLTITPEPPVAASTACENITGGYVENPIGGGAGIGATLRFASYNCTSLECQGDYEYETLGKEYKSEPEIISPPQSMPWPSMLEEVAGVVRSHIEGQVVEISCQAHGLSRAEAGEGGPSGAGENEQFQQPSGGPPGIKCVETKTHTQAPKFENGTNTGPNQSKLSFGSGGGSLACNEQDEGGWEGKTKESLHIMGYKNSELITVH
jgi:hypothetical protein